MSEGQHLASEARSINTKLQDGVVTSLPVQAGVQGGAIAQSFPRKFGGANAYDDTMRMRQQLVTDPATGATPFGQLQFDDKVAKWVENKTAVAEEANFDSWFGSNFNKNDLASRSWAQQINPEYYSSREQEVTAQAREILAMKLLLLRGPKSKEDLYRLFLLNTGRVSLKPGWDQIGKSAGPGGNVLSNAAQANFKRGLIRLPRLRSNTARGIAADAASNPFGDANSSRNTFHEQDPNLIASTRMFSNANSNPSSLASQFIGENILGQ